MFRALLLTVLFVLDVAAATLLFILYVESSAYAQNVTIIWTDNSNNETGFSLERASSLDGPFGAPIATTNTNVSTYIDTNLPVGDLSCYRVRAWNDVGFSAYSNIACATVQEQSSSDEQLTIACSSVDTNAALALWYKFDNNANDSSGNNHTGIAAGAATYAAGKLGRALMLTGADGRVRSPLTALSSKVSTFMAWTLRKGPGGGTLGRIFDKRTTGEEVLLLYNDESFHVYHLLIAWSGGVGSWAFQAPTLNEWHHIAVVYDASSPANQPKVYVDGELKIITQTKVPSGTLVINADPYILGNRGAGDRGWNGALDDVRMYDGKALSQQDIQAAMTGQ